MAYFPFMIELNDRKCVIAGGGIVAYRKAKTMLDFGARVTVIAPEICAELESLETICVVHRKVALFDVQDAFVVIMATNDVAVNHEIAGECRRLGILVNVVDVKDECGFYFPAIIKDGEVVVSVSTGGQSPTLAGRIKRELAANMRDDYGQMAEKLAGVRERVKENIGSESERKEFFSELVSEMCDSAAAGRPAPTSMTEYAEEYKAEQASNRNDVHCLRIGTRGSRLALVQAELVRAAISEAFPDIETEIITLSTKGDADKARPLVEFGGKAVFVEEFEDALLSGQIDIAVHSAKDMPMDIAEGLAVPGVLPRANPCDVFIYRKDNDIEAAGRFVVGTSSLRRQYQISAMYESAECRPLRGNIDTRIDKLRRGEYDAIILAAAGIERLGVHAEQDLVYKYLPLSDMVPAACQGIIAMETRSEGEAYHIAQSINDDTSYTQFMCERAVLQEMNAGCHEPVGVYAALTDGEITLTLMQAELADSKPRITKRTARVAVAEWKAAVRDVLLQ